MQLIVIHLEVKFVEKTLNVVAFVLVRMLIYLQTDHNVIVEHDSVVETGRAHRHKNGVRKFVIVKFKTATSHDASNHGLWNTAHLGMSHLSKRVDTIRFVDVLLHLVFKGGVIHPTQLFVGGVEKRFASNPRSVIGHTEGLRGVHNEMCIYQDKFIDLYQNGSELLFMLGTILKEIIEIYLHIYTPHFVITSNLFGMADATIPLGVFRSYDFTQMNALDVATFDRTMKTHFYDPMGVSSVSEMNTVNMLGLPDAALRVATRRRGCEMTRDELIMTRPELTCYRAALMDNEVIFDETLARMLVLGYRALEDIANLDYYLEEQNLGKYLDRLHATVETYIKANPEQF